MTNPPPPGACQPSVWQRRGGGITAVQRLAGGACWPVPLAASISAAADHLSEAAAADDAPGPVRGDVIAGCRLGSLVLVSHDYLGTALSQPERGARHSFAPVAIAQQGPRGTRPVSRTRARTRPHAGPWPLCSCARRSPRPVERPSGPNQLRSGRPKVRPAGLSRQMIHADAWAPRYAHGAPVLGMPQARPDRVPAAGEPGGLSGRDQVTVALLGEIRVDEHWLSPLGFWPDVPWSPPQTAPSGQACGRDRMTSFAWQLAEGSDDPRHAACAAGGKPAWRAGG
jgi:hypothetical protein